MKKLLCFFLALILLVSVVSCNKQDDKGEKLTAKVYLLNGSTGFGAAKLMDNAKNGNAKAYNYEFTVEKDASNITAALINGSADIAALPTNAAAAVYNKTKGAVQIICVNNLGVLYVVSKDENIKSIADLKGKTVYAPAQNPTFILKYLCERNGLVVGKDVTIDNTYAAPADLQAVVASGKVDVAVLPEPMLSACKTANKDLITSIDLTREWNAVLPEDSLVQGCIVARKEFIEKNTDAVKAFLSEFEASVKFANDNPKEASEIIVANGIFAKAPIAEKAIPGCNLHYIAGNDMEKGLDEFFKVMFSVEPTSIGGAVPDANIYYKG